MQFIYITSLREMTLIGIYYHAMREFIIAIHAAHSKTVIKRNFFFSFKERLSVSIIPKTNGERAVLETLRNSLHR